MKNLYFLVAVNLISFSLIAQSGTYVFDDSTEIYLQVVNSNPDKGRNAAIFLGAFGPEGMNILGGTYYIPKKSYLSVMAGLNGAIIDGNWLFFSKEKPIEMKQSISMENNTKYVARVPSVKRISFGAHFGTSYYQYNFSDEFSAMGIIGGFTLLRARHAQWLIESKYKRAQGTAISRLNADFVYYPYRQVSSQEDDVHIDEVSRKIGYRLYFDGKSTLWSRNGRVAIHYLFGIGHGSAKTGIFLMGGIGLGYSFM